MDVWFIKKVSVASAVSSVIRKKYFYIHENIFYELLSPTYRNMQLYKK